MLPRQTFRAVPPGHLPTPWLVSDQRTDAGLDDALRRLPRGAGLIFRHYHLAPAERAARFARLRALCRTRGIAMVWAGSAAEARRMRARGCYGPPALLSSGPALLRLVTAHSLREIAAAARARADAVLLSPVFPTRSHPGAGALGPLRWRLLAARSPVPVIALGGMDLRRARPLRVGAWAAIDGLASLRRPPASAGIPMDS